MKVYVHVTKGYRVVAMDHETCWEIIKRYYATTLQYHWRDISNHPAAQATFNNGVTL